MAAAREQPITIEGPAGRLEAILGEPPPGTATRGIAVVCHPHPQHHGTMHNKVVHTLSRAFAAHGIAALRFNFRGVGASDGEYDGGRGETEDAIAVVLYMRERQGDLPLWLAGFSFGSFVALSVAERERPTALVMVSPPVTRFEFGRSVPAGTRWLVLQGDADDVVDVDDVVAWADRLYPGPELVVLNGVGHFFHGKLTALRKHVERFIANA